MKKNLFFNFFLFFTFLLFAFAASGQNLIVNPSAEQVPTSNGWTAAQTAGTNCFTGSGWRITGNQNGFPAAQQGTYLFFPGCGGGNNSNRKYELYQNINVSSNATAIDDGRYVVTFSGYTRSYAQTPADITEIIIEFRNASNSVISSYTTGTATNTAGWVQ
jgi:hypothetical protein